MKEIAAQETEVNTYQKPTFRDLSANTFVLFDIIGCARLKTLTITRLTKLEEII